MGQGQSHGHERKWYNLSCLEWSILIVLISIVAITAWSSFVDMTHRAELKKSADAIANNEDANSAAGKQSPMAEEKPADRPVTPKPSRGASDF